MENKPNLNQTSKFQTTTSKENPNSNIFLSVNVNNSKPKILELIIEDQKEENISNKSNDNNLNIEETKEELVICQIPGKNDIPNKEFPIESKLSLNEDDIILKNNDEINKKKINEIPIFKTNNNLKTSIIVGPKNLTNSLELVTGSIISHYGEEAYFPCFICDKFYIKNDFNYIDNSCNHCFCKKCGKNFYEELIEDGEIKMKCPKYKCENILSNDSIKNIVSDQHYNLYIKNLEKSERSNSNRIILDNTDLIDKEKDKDKNKDKEKNKLKELQFYIYNHVIDVNSNKNFYLFNKAKMIFCSYCYEPSLYSRSGNNYIKCLNCGKSICKYCFKIYDKNHFDFKLENHCKVYSRKRFISLKKQNHFNIFLSQLALVIISYIMLYIGLYCYIYNCFEALCSGKKKYIQNLFFKLFIIFFSILFTIILSPFFIILLPYFPVFNEIFS